MARKLPAKSARAPKRASKASKAPDGKASKAASDIFATIYVDGEAVGIAAAYQGWELLDVGKPTERRGRPAIYRVFTSENGDKNTVLVMLGHHKVTRVVMTEGNSDRPGCKYHIAWTLGEDGETGEYVLTTDDFKPGHFSKLDGRLAPFQFQPGAQAYNTLKKIVCRLAEKERGVPWVTEYEQVGYKGLETDCAFYLSTAGVLTSDAEFIPADVAAHRVSEGSSSLAKYGYACNIPRDDFNTDIFYKLLQGMNPGGANTHVDVALLGATTRVNFPAGFGDFAPGAAPCVIDVYGKSKLYKSSRINYHANGCADLAFSSQAIIGGQGSTTLGTARALSAHPFMIVPAMDRKSREAQPKLFQEWAKLQASVFAKELATKGTITGGTRAEKPHTGLLITSGESDPVFDLIEDKKTSGDLDRFISLEMVGMSQDERDAVLLVSEEIENSRHSIYASFELMRVNWLVKHRDGAANNFANLRDRQAYELIRSQYRSQSVRADQLASYVVSGLMIFSDTVREIAPSSSLPNWIMETGIPTFLTKHVARANWIYSGAAAQAEADKSQTAIAILQNMIAEGRAYISLGADNSKKVTATTHKDIATAALPAVIPTLTGLGYRDLGTNRGFDALPGAHQIGRLWVKGYDVWVVLNTQAFPDIHARILRTLQDSIPEMRGSDNLVQSALSPFFIKSPENKTSIPVKENGKAVRRYVVPISALIPDNSAEYEENEYLVNRDRRGNGSDAGSPGAPPNGSNGHHAPTPHANGSGADGSPGEAPQPVTSNRKKKTIPDLRGAGAPVFGEPS